MNCPQCGAALEPNATECKCCGEKIEYNDIFNSNNNPVVATQDNVMVTQTKKKKTVPIVLGIVSAVFVVVALFVVFIICFGSSNVDLVKNGTLKAYPDENIGVAFENFFANPTWEEFTSEDGDKIVEFNGDCYWYGEPENCCIQFKIYDDNSFEIAYAEVGYYTFNSEIELIGLLSVIYEG